MGIKVHDETVAATHITKTTLAELQPQTAIVSEWQAQLVVD